MYCRPVLAMDAHVDDSSNLASKNRQLELASRELVVAGVELLCPTEPPWNPFEILGYDPQLQGQEALVTKAEVKSRVRRVQLRNHPDKQPGKSDEEKAAAEATFKRVG